MALVFREIGLSFAGLGPFRHRLGPSRVAQWCGVFGRLADRSSRSLMVLGAAVSSLIIVVLLALRTMSALAAAWWRFPSAYLLLMLAHTGVRVARKTYVVDLASSNRRTDYVAVSNTAMGGPLLITGALSSALAEFGVEIAPWPSSRRWAARGARRAVPTGGEHRDLAMMCCRRCAETLERLDP